MTNSPEISYQLIKPTLYKVEVKNTKEPFVLAFSESYHPSWKAEIDGQELNPIPLYGLINGFQIEKTGNFNLTVEFTLQKYILPSLAVSIVFAAGSLCYLILATIKSRNGTKSQT